MNNISDFVVSLTWFLMYHNLTVNQWCSSFLVPSNIVYNHQIPFLKSDSPPVQTPE
jgi:hypothetical protein